MTTVPKTRVYRLVRHDGTPCRHPLQLTVAVARPGPSRLQLEYILMGDSSSIVLPPHNDTPRPTLDLWRHTCFEVFMAHGDATGYHEFNFSPSSDWAVFAFSAPRQRVADCSSDLRPNVSCQATDTGLRLVAKIQLPDPVRAHRCGAAVGLSAVVEHTDGRRCYWALAHPCDDPDFHARAGWLAGLPAASNINPS